VSILDNISAQYARGNYDLKKNLKISRSNYTPEQFIKKALTISIMVGIVITIIVFLFVDKRGEPWWYVPIGTVVGFVGTFLFFEATPFGAINTRAREINKEILFAGRYLLIKLESGEPLFNALIDTSQSYGVAAKYFREIVDDINTGTPIEDALENALEFNASTKLKRVLWQLLGALKTGAEVTHALKAVLAGITAEQIIEIKEYGKKLNSLMMFYLVMAVVAPSLGLTMMVILSSFLELSIDRSIFFVILFFLVVIQMAFVLVIKASRPMVNL